MQTLISNKKKIFEIIEKVENFDSSMITHYNYPNIPIYDDTISIVMTSSNRSRQVYYTLETIEKCSFKHIHVIIVDDSNVDPVILSMINGFAFYIDLVIINNKNKNWINPVVNYNIGFKFIKGSKVVIQNSEVCHVGDVLGWISKYITDNNYYCFDVKAVESFEGNNEIYKIKDLTTNIYSKDHIDKIEDTSSRSFKVSLKPTSQSDADYIRKNLDGFFGCHAIIKEDRTYWNKNKWVSY